jgi:hypothetical protein
MKTMITIIQLRTMKVFNRRIFLSLLPLLPFFLSGQKINSFIVSDPVTLAGKFSVAQAEWGDTSGFTFEADGVYAIPQDGCSPLENNVQGKVVFTERGVCSFARKALEAQKSGAVAVVICDNTPDESLFLMPGDSLASQVILPVFLAAKETCHQLEVALINNGISTAFLYDCKKPSYSSNVVWGDKPGQGDFKNGFAGWTTDQGWVYNPEGIIRKGAYTGAPRVVGSATACDGMVEFNSDYLDNKSVPGAFESGDCPAPCKGSLISPIIHMNQPLGGLVIEFSQSLRQFQSQYFLIVSKDGGLNWTDTIQFNKELQVNTPHLSERKKIFFVGYEGVSTLRFKFEIIGNYYYWALDDIVIIDELIADLRIDRSWYSVAPYYKMPRFQVSEIPFMAAIQNDGNEKATNVTMHVNITGPATNQHIEHNFGIINPKSNWKNLVFPKTFLSPDNVGTYQAEYFITGNEEEDGPENRVGFQWKVTEKTFGVLDTEEEFGSKYLASLQNFIIHQLPYERFYSCANVFYVPSGNSQGQYIASVARYGLENPLSEVLGQTIRVDLFEWVDSDNSGTSSPSERKRVGCNYQIIHDEIQNLRSIETDIWASDDDNEPIEGERVALKDNTHYLVSVSVMPMFPKTDPEMKLLVYTARGLNNYYRSIGAVRATNAVLDSLETKDILGNRVAGSLRAWENVLDVSTEDIDKRNFRYIFNGSLYTKNFIELDIELRVAQSEDTKLPLHSLKTFPNPAARELFIDLWLEKMSSEVEIFLFDTEGKLVFTQTFNNIMNDRIKLDVSGMTNGMYNLKVVTKEGTAIRKVVVQN